VSGPSISVVGREPEIGVISGFLDHVSDGPHALIIEGSAGIGKTTLWSAGVSSARERGYQVLMARAAESEARLSYAALGDLLGGVRDQALSGLSAPLRRGLDAALLRADDPTGAPDQRAVSLATAQVLRNLAAESPVVVAVDDVQWLDRSSARVLSFALRRISNDLVGAFVTLRLAPGSPGDLLDLNRAVERTTHLPVGPLPPEPLGRVLRERTGTDLSHAIIARLHRVTGGNPLFALEIARAAVLGGDKSPRGDIWSVPEDLQKLLSARLARVPSAAHPALLAIAAASQPTWDMVVQVAGADERTRGALRRAEDMGIIERAGGRVRFTHPLLGSTLYLNSPLAERRQLHGRLAVLTADLEERARHLALSANGPDEGVASALEAAARHARARGAPDAAAELAELSCEMTVEADGVDLRRRRLAATEYHFDGGDIGKARRLLREMIDASPRGPVRAEMLYRLASMSWMDMIDGVRAPCEEALAEAPEDPDLLCGLYVNLAWVALYLDGLDEAFELARTAARWAQGAVSAAQRSDALATLAIIKFLRGEPDDEMLAAAVALQDEALAEVSWTTAAVFTTPRTVLGLQQMWSMRLDDARTIFEQEVGAFERLAMHVARAEVHHYLTEVECRAGDGSRASLHAAEVATMLEESGEVGAHLDVGFGCRAASAALRGDADVARRLASEGLRVAESISDRFTAAWNSAILGFLDVSNADYARAIRDLEPATRFLDDLNPAEPGVFTSMPDLVEALVAVGRVPEAERRIERLEAQAGARGGSWAVAVAARGRALVAASRGDLEGAEAAALRSIAGLEELNLAFEAARSRLVLGQVHRRAKKKRVAREQLEAARNTFVALEASLWAERTEAELARIGGRRSSPFELTDTEQQIAALVAQGRTNQETADVLFVSPSTVQANLKHIYQKLGVRSRTELAARIRGDS